MMDQHGGRARRNALAADHAAELRVGEIYVWMGVPTCLVPSTCANFRTPLSIWNKVVGVTVRSFAARCPVPPRTPLRPAHCGAGVADPAQQRQTAEPSKPGRR